MAISQKLNGRAMSLPGGVLLGSAMSLLWTIAASVILAKLMETETLREASIGYGSMVILLTASMLGSGIAWRRVKRQPVVVCLVTGGTYLLMLMGITALFFGGQYEAVGVTALLVIAGCTVTLLWTMKKRKSGAGRQRRTYRK